MLVRHLAGKINRYTAEWDEQRARVATPQQVEARNRDVRQTMRRMMHGFPERTPLDGTTVRAFERKGYRVENVMFQSRPDFWVTGNLYVPTTGAGPFPGIISPCGHYPEARMAAEYQCAYINLALGGFVVLAYDPIGQGERRQYWNPNTKETDVGGPTTEHSMVGHLLFLVGEDLTHYRVWDGMRAIDYLETRKEVDPKRIGCAGHSGGGTLTRFIAAVDERVQCAVINEGGTANRWPLQIGPEARLGPSDVEQNLFPSAKLGVDHVDMQVAIAPRPLLVQIEDFYPRFDEAVKQIRERYTQLGAADKFEAIEATDPHAWTPRLRLATTRWFSRWFYGKPGPEVEPEMAVEPVEALYSTQNGSIRYAKKGKTIYDLVREKAAKLPLRPSGLTRSRLRELLRVPGPAVRDLGVRHLVTTERRGYRIEKVEFLAEAGVYIPTWVFVPATPDASKPTVLWVDERGKESEGMEFGRLERMAREGTTVISIDVRGVGATRGQHASAAPAGPFGHLFDQETAATYLAWYIDESLLGMRVFDVMRAVEYWRWRAEGQKLQAIGRGSGAVWALMAAALDDRIESVRAERMLVSYKSLTQTDRYLHNASLFLKDGLMECDLPQIAGLVAPRTVTLVEPVNAMRRVAGKAEAAGSYGAVANVTIA